MKYHHIINLRRLMLLTVVLLSTALPTLAQSDLAIGPLFDGRYRNSKNVTETILTGNVLKEYNISTFRGLEFTGDSEIAKTVVPLVKRDAEKAVSKEVKLKKGELYGAFYELPRKGDKRRFIFFLNRFLTGDNKLILVYIEGKANMEELKQLM